MDRGRFFVKCGGEPKAYAEAALRPLGFAARNLDSPASPLNSHDSRKKAAWMPLPLAWISLPDDLDIPSPGFENPSMHLQVKCFT
jgi:hypothetical protein